MPESLVQDWLGTSPKETWMIYRHMELAYMHLQGYLTSHVALVI